MPPGACSWSPLRRLLTSLVFVLAIRRGEGGISASDRLMIVIAAGGVIGWMIAEEPIIATACVVGADLIAAALMIPKTYRDPDSETLATFAFASLGGLLAAGAVGRPDLSLLVYPIYFCLVNGAIAILIHHRRVVLHHDGCEPAHGGAIIDTWCAVSRVRSSSGARSNWRRSTPRSRQRGEAWRPPFW